MFTVVYHLPSLHVTITHLLKPDRQCQLSFWIIGRHTEVQVSAPIRHLR